MLSNSRGVMGVHGDIGNSIESVESCCTNKFVDGRQPGTYPFGRIVDYSDIRAAIPIPIFARTDKICKRFARPIGHSGTFWRFLDL